MVDERRRASPERSTFPLWPVLFLAAWCGVTSGGCSAFFVVGPPPEDQRQGVFECTTSDAYPVADMVLAGLTIVGIGLAAGEGASRVAGIVGAPLLGGYVGSGIGGFWRVSKCKKALSGE